jgi:hypothetical protein
MIFVAIAFFLPVSAEAATSVPNSGQRAVLTAWLNRNPQFRLATEKDCDCGDDIKQVRTNGPWGESVPDYEPYMLVGDFRKNGQSDLAVVVTKIEASNAEGMLVIFDGPFRRANKQPAFIGSVGALAHEALFLTQQDKIPIFGAFGSEGCVFRPDRRVYTKDCGSD